MSDSLDNTDNSTSQVGQEFTLDDLLAASAHELPPVSETAEGFVDAAANVYDAPEVIAGDVRESEAERTQQNPSEIHRGKLSSKGDKFLPGVHEYPPRELKSGKWAKIRGRKGQEKSQPDIQAEKTGADIRAHAENIALMYGDLHKTVYGMDGGRAESGHVSQLANAVERYLIEKGDIQLSATPNLLINMLGYSRSVAARPENEKINKKVLGFLSRTFSPVLGWFKKGKKKEDKKQEQEQVAQEQPLDTENIYEHNF